MRCMRVLYCGSVCGFLVFWLQIVTEPFALFHHSVFNYMFFNVTFHRWRRGLLCGPNIYLQFGVRFRANTIGLSTYLPSAPHSTHTPSSKSTDRIKAVFLLQFLFVCAYVVSYEAFVLSLFVPHISFFWYLVSAVLCECGIFWVSFTYIFFNIGIKHVFSCINIRRRPRFSTPPKGPGEC